MFRCKIINFLFLVFPIKPWQSFLIRHHIQKCHFCQAKLASGEEVKSFLIQEDEVGNLEGLWPAVREGFGKEKEKKRRVIKPRWKWAVGTACLVVAIAVAIWLYRPFTLDEVPSDENIVERFQINYIKVGEKPARAFLFQPQDSNMIIVWVEKDT